MPIPNVTDIRLDTDIQAFREKVAATIRFHAADLRAGKTVTLDNQDDPEGWAVVYWWIAGELHDAGYALSIKSDNRLVVALPEFAEPGMSMPDGYERAKP